MSSPPPIEWREFGAIALAEAQEVNKPIFLSVGYFSCYWCHVMEDQVYTEAEFAAYVNAHFIPVKVDRDLRPDVNDIYLRARELITKKSGWPNHVFLTPEGAPFMACGVMLPGRSPDLFGVAQQVQQSWQNNEPQLREAAGHITCIIEQELAVAVEDSDGTPDKSVTDDLLAYLKHHYDAQHGGFYGAPKFSHENYLLFLLSDYRRRKDQSAIEMVALSLKKMAAGALHDAVGGGFHRYCSDAQWQTPHFEKMLYNQALMARCYTELYAITGKPYHRDLAESTLDFMLQSLRNSDGLFHAAIDAETNGKEGEYYLWQEAELKDLLTPSEVELFAKCFCLVDVPVHPGHVEVDGKALVARDHLIALANEKSRSYESLRDSLNPILQKLKQHRQKRPAPEHDTKVITGWNGLVIDALAHASKTLERPDYLEAAKQTAEQLWMQGMLEGVVLLRCTGQPIHGFLEDYAYVEAALLSLYEITAEPHWLDRAKRLHRVVDKLFWDARKGGYFMTDGHHKLLVRVHKGHDTGLPSANGVILQSLFRLWEATGQEDWLARARMIMAVYEKDMHTTPADYSTMIQAVLYLYRNQEQ